MASPKQLSFFQLLDREIQKELEAFEKKKFRFKLKLFFTLILPIAIILLTVKVAQTFLKLKLKSITNPSITPASPKTSTPIPMPKEILTPIFITPEPVPTPDSLTITDLPD